MGFNSGFKGLRKGMTLHDQRPSTSVDVCLQNQVAIDTYRQNEIPPAKQTFNISVKIRSVFFLQPLLVYTYII